MNERRISYLIALVFILALAVAGYLAIQHNDQNSAAISYEGDLAACDAYPEGSTQTIPETSRLTIYLPRDLYPNQERLLTFETATGTATAGFVSNAGPVAHSYGATNDCFAYYYEFDGQGVVDLVATSSAPGTPTYRVHFIVTPTDTASTTPQPR